MYGPLHLNVTSAAAHLRFWVDTLGAVSINRGGRSPGVLKFPNVEMILREQPPTGGTKGTAVNHIAFGVPDIRSSVDRVKAAGYPIVTRAELPDRFEVRDDLGFIPALQTNVAFTMGPDDIKVEFLEVPSASSPISLHHIHFFSADMDAMKAWYAATFDAAPGERGPFQAVDLPGGVNLTFSAAPGPVVPTRGRVLDRIGLEVRDLEEFCRRLSSDVPVDRSDGVVVRDPWGTSIELVLANSTT